LKLCRKKLVTNCTKKHEGKEMLKKARDKKIMKEKKVTLKGGLKKISRKL